MLQGDIAGGGEECQQDLPVRVTGPGGLDDGPGFLEFPVGRDMEPDDVLFSPDGRFNLGKQPFPALDEELDFFRIHIAALRWICTKVAFFPETPGI